MGFYWSNTLLLWSSLLMCSCTKGIALSKGSVLTFDPTVVEVTLGCIGERHGYSSGVTKVKGQRLT